MLSNNLNEIIGVSSLCSLNLVIFVQNRTETTVINSKLVTQTSQYVNGYVGVLNPKHKPALNCLCH